MLAKGDATKSQDKMDRVRDDCKRSDATIRRRPGKDREAPFSPQSWQWRCGVPALTKAGEKEFSTDKQSGSGGVINALRRAHRANIDP